MVEVAQTIHLTINGNPVPRLTRGHDLPGSQESRDCHPEPLCSPTT